MLNPNRDVSWKFNGAFDSSDLLSVREDHIEYRRDDPQSFKSSRPSPAPFIHAPTRPWTCAETEDKKKGRLSSVQLCTFIIGNEFLKVIVAMVCRLFVFSNSNSSLGQTNRTQNDLTAKSHSSSSFSVATVAALGIINFQWQQLPRLVRCNWGCNETYNNIIIILNRHPSFDPQFLSYSSTSCSRSCFPCPSVRGHL